MPALSKRRVTAAPRRRTSIFRDDRRSPVATARNKGQRGEAMSRFPAISKGAAARANSTGPATAGTGGTKGASSPGFTLRKRGIRVFEDGSTSKVVARPRGTFVPNVKLDTSQVRDLRGKTLVRGTTLRSRQAMAATSKHRPRIAIPKRGS